MSAIEKITKQELEQHLLSLDKESVAHRFGFPANEETIKRYIEGISDDDILLGIKENIFSDNVITAVHLAFDNAKETVELGISTLPGYKRRGFGERILRYSVDILRNRGIKQIYSICAPANSALMGLIRKLNITSITSTPGQKEAVIAIPMAGIDSILHEIRNDRFVIIDKAMKPWADLWQRMLVK